MSRAKISVRQLANEAELVEDDAILLLWEAGINVRDSPRAFIPRSKLSRARRAVGLHPSKLRTPISTVIGSTPTASAILKPELASDAPFTLSVVGPVTDVVQISLEEVVTVHMALVKEFKNSNDPIFPAGIARPTELDSAVHRPLTSFDGTRKYPTVFLAGAALMHSLTHNHPFFNGNKRTAIVSLLVFLEHNDMTLSATEIEMYRFVKSVSRHKIVVEISDQHDREVEHIARWLNDRVSPVTTEEKLLKFHELRKVLKNYGCEVTILSNGSVEFEMTFTERRWFAKGTVRRGFQMPYGGEGREVPRRKIKQLRSELWLDDDHGVDSSRFYASRPGIDEFISMHRTLLRKLARN